jgi:hypothetical protein
MASQRHGPRELALLEALRSSRAMFHQDIIACGKERGRSQTQKSVVFLRSGYTHQIAEFFYLAHEYALADTTRFAAFLRKHNDRMEELLANPPMREAIGLRGKRAEKLLKWAMFRPESRLKAVVEESVHGARSARLALKHAVLARLLVEIMSPETCSKATKTLLNAGLLEWYAKGTRKAGIGPTADGALETLFRKHLIHVLAAL